MGKTGFKEQSLRRTQTRRKILDLHGLRVLHVRDVETPHDLSESLTETEILVHVGIHGLHVVLVKSRGLDPVEPERLEPERSGSEPGRTAEAGSAEAEGSEGDGRED